MTMSWKYSVSLATVQLSSNIAVAEPVLDVSVSAGHTSFNTTSDGQVRMMLGASSSSTVIVWVHVAVLSLPQASLAMAVNVRVMV